MRPVRLEFQGFGTFRDRTVVDFDDLDLLAFVGPTGSGKSTVIDAITFALYGSVARYDNPSLVAPIIHQLSTEARVRFDFEVAGVTYVAVRVVRRLKSKPGAAPRATTREARLERLEPGVEAASSQSTVLAGSVSELDGEINRIIGLDFGQFTRTIVLPQGDFAEFLTDDPSNRQKLLRRLLDIDIYARMGAEARERAARAGQQAEAYGHELERLGSVTPERLAAAEQAVVALDVFAEAADGWLDRLAAIEADLVERREQVTRLDADLERLAAIAVPVDLCDTDAAMVAAKQRLTDAEAALAEGRRRRDEAAAALAAVGDPVALSRQLARCRRDAELAIAISQLDEELIAARDGHAGHERDLAEAQDRHDEATERVRAALTGADAAAWVARLRAGEPCPICRQAVTDVPGTVGHDVVAEAEKQAAARQRALAAVTTAQVRSEAGIERLEAELSRHRRDRADLAEAIGANPPSIAELETALTAAEAGAGEARAASELVREAEAAVTAATDGLASAEAAEGRFRRAYDLQRDTVAELGPPRPDTGSLAGDWAALGTWAAELVDRLQRERADIADAGKELAGAKSALMAEIGAAADPFGLRPDPATLATSTAAARARAAADVDSLAERLAHKEELTATVAELAETRTVHEALGRQHLSANGFERWLLAEALDDLVARATERLVELSNGRYSLEAIDGSFCVRDHTNADERRDVRTLSGGEIFLASLSLALALAESIAELAPVDSPRLGSIFLDEGFGTLDGDTLDVLASAIEELSASGRLVAIVTHVRDLAERMPVRFEVRKGATTSSIERTEG
ncbi:MAG: SMC family ATPase [Acidimicrobiia bacterium]|nr:SMC family ATPase [Acidimicrobiia bacterium]